MHLLLPLAASLLFVSSLILINRASKLGIRPLTVLFLANMFSAVLFSVLWLFGGNFLGWSLLWQPMIIAALFMLGLILTFMAVERGDVSVATPVLGLKVLIVVVLLTIVGHQQLPPAIWYSAVLASLGVGMIQWTGVQDRGRILLTILLALSAASCYATFDVLVQRWAPAWQAGRFLPLTYWMVGLFSLGMIPWVQWQPLKKRQLQKLVIPGAFLMACQAICIVLALAVFGDAARVNVVYSLRGLWAVGLAWIVAKIWGGAEAELSRGHLLTRLGGAGLLTAAVVLAIVFGSETTP